MLRDEQFAEVRDRFLVRSMIRSWLGSRGRPATAAASPPRSALPRSGRSFASGVAWSARLAAGRPVPAFHRKDAEPVADAHAVALERLAERRHAGAASVSSNSREIASCSRCARNAAASSEMPRAGNGSRSQRQFCFLFNRLVRADTGARGLETRPCSARERRSYTNAAQKREIWLRVGEGMSPALPGSVVASGRIGRPRFRRVDHGARRRCHLDAGRALLAALIEEQRWLLSVMNSVAFVPKKSRSDPRTRSIQSTSRWPCGRRDSRTWRRMWSYLAAVVEAVDAAGRGDAVGVCAEEPVGHVDLVARELGEEALEYFQQPPVQQVLHVG